MSNTQATFDEIPLTISRIVERERERKKDVCGEQANEQTASIFTQREVMQASSARQCSEMCEDKAATISLIRHLVTIRATKV